MNILNFHLGSKLKLAWIPEGKKGVNRQSTYILWYLTQQFTNLSLSLVQKKKQLAALFQRCEAKKNALRLNSAMVLGPRMQ